jgi:pimeloyl-ACP methyl ester carboxylesterase
MDEPASAHKPLSRSFQVIRDIGSVVDHIRQKHGVKKVTLIGWSWGAMTAGYYASLHSENVQKLVMYAPAYSFPLHTNLGPGSALQNKRKPYEFNYALGAYRTATTAANTARWDGEIPVADKSQYRDPDLPKAFWDACLATDPTSGTRNPPALRAPNGVLEDTFMQETGRPIWNASSIYVPVLVIAGEYDTWSYPEDREGLMRDLTNAPAKRSVLIKDATHFVLFEKPRMEFFNEILRFLKEPSASQ